MVELGDGPHQIPVQLDGLVVFRGGILSSRLPTAMLCNVNVRTNGRWILWNSVFRRRSLRGLRLLGIGGRLLVRP